MIQNSAVFSALKKYALNVWTAGILILFLIQVDEKDHK